MIIEHVAFNVKDPGSVVKWYIENIGLKLIKRVNEYTWFIGDENSNTVLEIYYNPAAEVLEYANMDPLMLHIAFVSNKIEEDIKRLVEAGATVVNANAFTKAGDRLAMLRDPWGLCIQLVDRVFGNKMKP